MLLLTWCACYFPKIIILRFKVISEKICKNPVNTEKTFSKYYITIVHLCCTLICVLTLICMCLCLHSFWIHTCSYGKWAQWLSFGLYWDIRRWRGFCGVRAPRYSNLRGWRLWSEQVWWKGWYYWPVYLQPPTSLSPLYFHLPPCS
jgi:hypothetical protein